MKTKKYAVWRIKIPVTLSIGLCLILTGCKNNDFPANLIDPTAWERIIFDVSTNFSENPVQLSFSADSTAITFFQPAPFEISQAIFQKVKVPAHGDYNMNMKISKDSSAQKFWFAVLVSAVKPKKMMGYSHNVIWEIENCKKIKGKSLDNVSFSEVACKGFGNPVTINTDYVYVVIAFGSWTGRGTLEKIKATDISLTRVKNQ